MSQPHDSAVTQMLAAARAARNRAHAPYSNFLVGAAVVDELGRVHAGCNVENAAYPLGDCAETGAIGGMVLGGGKRVKTLLVVGQGNEPVTPCGGCRQKLREFGEPDTPVLIANRDGILARYTLGELLPASFGPENLRTKDKP